MVINSAGFQNAGKEVMLFSDASASKGTKENTDSFSAIFNSVTGNSTDFYSKMTLSANTANTAKSVKAANPANTADTANTSATQNTDSYSDDVTQVSQKSADLEDDTAITDASDNDVTDTAAAEEAESSVEDIEKAATLLIQVTVTITEVLNVSMEDLENGMQELGMDVSDLLQPDSRYSLFVNLKASGNAVNLLKDNSLVDLFNTMENQLADLFTTEGINAGDTAASLTDCLEAVMDKVNELMTATTGTSDTDALKAQNQTKTELNGDQTVVIDGIENTDAKDTTKAEMSQDNSTDSNSTDTPKKDRQEDVKAETVTDKFVDHMVNTFENKFSEMKVAETQYTPNLREIVDQIMDQVKVHLNSDTTSLEIQLTPESLGKVQVSVEDNNGVMTAKFQAESRTAKEAIESNLIQFKENLAQQGIKVDSVEVSVGNFDFTGNEFGKNHGQEAESHVKRHFSMEDAEMSGTQTEDLKEAAYIESGTSTVSFTA